MKQRRFDVERINQLAEEYVQTSDDAVFERLMLEELEPIIGVQLGRSYTSVKDFWDDMRQEVLLYLWKNRESVKTTKSKVYYGWYWKMIRHKLYYITNKKCNNYNKNGNSYIMKIANYDSRTSDTIFFDDLSDADRIKLGIGNIEENYGE